MLSAKTVIRKADEYLKEGDNRSIKDEFLEKYSKCEVLCRPILREYLMNIGEDVNDEDIGMERELIKNALSEMGYVVDDKKLLTRIWGSSCRKDSSSCRFLRNKITHELMERALHEVVDRQEELNSDMDKFIEILMVD